ncbi:hypothetical protein E0L10_09225 [Enterococcus durans]|uniref:hypothetical protein n=1 Tax=Enterococcus durans TaxID=53345 RepID=UPI00142F42E5|nr:hypothetical protein [Enterococcus durans]NJE64309.1 hypothetical protein [Enterococcus durans]
MDWSVITTSLITACIPSAFAYLTATIQAKNKLKEVESQFKNEIYKLDKQHEHQIELLTVQFNQENQKSEKDIINDIAAGVITGKYDMSQLLNVSQEAEKLSKFSNQNKS